MNALDKAKQLFLEGLQLLESEQHELAESKLMQAHLLVPDRLSILVNLSAIQIKLEKFDQAKLVRVPYKMNRCVLFDSTYFHTTDEIHFKEGYENRRINCTLLFGKGL